MEPGSSDPEAILAEPFNPNGHPNETSSVKIQDLKKWDIIFLVMNKMIGVGIYFVPAQVALIFSIYCVSNGEIQASNSSTYKFVAFTTVLLIYSVHFGLRNFGLWLNKYLAWLKFATLFSTIFILAPIGGALARKWTGPMQNSFGASTPSGYETKPDASFRDFGQVHNGPESTSTKFGSVVIAMMLVLYTFRGWENANYVTAEIDGDPEEKTEKLKLGVRLAVVIVGVLYLLFNTAIFLVLDYETIAKYNGSLSVLQGLFQTIRCVKPSDGGFLPGELVTARASAALIAISSLGSTIGGTYTSARVKREIARHQLLPFSSIFAKSSDMGKTQDEDGTPAGGLVLDFLASVGLIIATPIHNGSSEGITFLILLVTYGQSISGVLLGLPFWALRRMVKVISISQQGLLLPDDVSEEVVDDSPAFSRKYLTNTPIRYFICTFLLTFMNLLIFIGPWINKPTEILTWVNTSSGTPSEEAIWVPRRFPIRNVCFIAIGCYGLGAIVSLYILAFATQIVFFGPQGPLERHPVVLDRYRYPDPPGLPDPLEVMQSRQEQSQTPKTENPFMDDANFKLDGDSGYYVREKDRRWIILFDLDFGRFFRVTWREEIAMIKAAIACVIQRRRWRNGYKRTTRFWRRLWAHGESALPGRAREDLERAKTRSNMASGTDSHAAKAEGAQIHVAPVPAPVAPHSGPIQLDDLLITRASTAPART
ncbi:hypothetical protein TWF191_003624 [Orbilia oligospora]|uniref:Uncharacterized protein n=2 Tax=Orbilia oligospora TaxID=2813651 RepID=A0A7C8QVZ0_ORBOL|nr:hypothetical protein TWF679_010046 [Orbilia oligospora]KAF3227540.1 hypothetical protein TWF191_003624 [Orbilia oligospora]